MNKEINMQEFMSHFFTTVARQRIEKMIQGQKLLLEEKEKNISVDRAHGEYISIIMLWSSVGAIFLKIHFDLDTAKKLVAKALGKDELEVSREIALDFMKECCNGVGGYIRSLLETHRLLMGMSLPFLALGSDEIIFKKIRDPRAYCSESSLKLEDGSHFVFSSELCLLESRSLVSLIGELEKAMAEGDMASESEGDVEFLF